MLSDVNRYLSAFVAIAIALAVARPILKNLCWALTILLGSPVRAAAWLVDTIDTEWSEYPPASSGRRVKPGEAQSVELTQTACMNPTRLSAPAMAVRRTG